MIYNYSEIKLKTAIKWYVFTFFVSIFFAFFFWAISKQYPLYYHFVFSLCQGFSIMNFGAFANIILKHTGSIPRLFGIFLFCNVGSIAGKFLAPVLLGTEFITPQEFIFLSILNLMVISIIIGFVYYWEGIAVTNSKIQEEKKQQLCMEKQMIQTQLKLIQTQIEPEFLFRILNYILSLLDIKPEKARATQMALIQYLRMTLAKFKKETHTVSQEMEMIRAYLDILVVLHENRMSHQIDIPDILLKNEIPAMLVHSFVDKIAGLIPVSPVDKTIYLKADKEPDGLRFEISGKSMDGLLNNHLIGHLEMISERLQTIYGSRGKLILTPESTADRKIILKIPHGEFKSDQDSR